MSSCDRRQDLPSDITPVEHVLADDAPIMLDEEGARQAFGAQVHPMPWRAHPNRFIPKAGSFRLERRMSQGEDRHP